MRGLARDIMRAVQPRQIPRVTGAAALGAALAMSIPVSSRLVAAQRVPASVLSQLTWFSRTGTMLGRVGPLADHGNLELSPDGTRVAVAVMDPSTRTRDLWIYDAKS